MKAHFQQLGFFLMVQFKWFRGSVRLISSFKILNGSVLTLSNQTELLSIVNAILIYSLLKAKNLGIHIYLLFDGGDQNVKFTVLNLCGIQTYSNEVVKVIG